MVINPLWFFCVFIFEFIVLQTSETYIHIDIMKFLCYFLFIMRIDQREHVPPITVEAPVEDRHMDELTGLPNSAWLNGALAELTEKHSGNFSILSLDLDGFKAVNDTMGHVAGDLKLMETANALVRITRESDILVSRPHGDEFILILVGVNEEKQLEGARSRIQKGMDDSDIPTSIGGSIHQVGETPVSLLDRADSAMRDDKESRKLSELTPESIQELKRIGGFAAKYSIPHRDFPILLDAVAKLPDLAE